MLQTMSYVLKSGAAVLFSAVLAGCAAMEGTNVGVNIPIGGVVNVGANKTIGERPAAPKPQTPETPEKDPEESGSTAN